MTAWFRRACDRALNLGLTIDELRRRVHGRLDDRQMVTLVLSLEEQLQADMDSFERERAA
jgi:hypothetical protein